MPDDETKHAISQLLVKFLGPGAEETGQLIADNIRLLRWKNSIRIIRKAEEHSQKHGLKREQLPLKFLLPFFEKSSIEEPDNPLFDRWARLLANAANQYSDRCVTYLSLLSTLTFQEAQLLQRMWKTCSPREVFGPYVDEPFAEFDPSEDNLEALLGAKDITDADLNISGAVVFFWNEDNIPNTNEFNLYGFEPYPDLLHLQSLGLATVTFKSLLAKHKRHFVLVGRITAFGYEFVEACEGPADE